MTIQEQRGVQNGDGESLVAVLQGVVRGDGAHHRGELVVERLVVGLVRERERRLEQRAALDVEGRKRMLG